MPSRKSVTRSVRLDADVDGLVQALAAKERVSVNLLINKALRKFVNWDTQAANFGFMSLPSSLHAKMFGLITQDEAKQLGQWLGHNFGKDFVMFWFKKMDVESILKALELLSSDYARVFQFEHSCSGREHTLVIKHGRGVNGSIFNAEFLRTLFKDLKKEVRIEQTEDQVVAHVLA